MFSAAPSAEIPSIDITQLLQFGFVGVVLACIIVRRWLVPEWTLKQSELRAETEKRDLTERLAESQAQLRNLQATFEEQMIPALTRSTDLSLRLEAQLDEARRG